MDQFAHAAVVTRPEVETIFITNHHGVTYTVKVGQRGITVSLSHADTHGKQKQPMPQLGTAAIDRSTIRIEAI